MKRLLEVGDVIRIKNGMRIYANVQERFIFSNRRKSEDWTTHDITVGDVLHDGSGKEFRTCCFTGEYVVTETSFGGGSSGGGMNGHDDYPNGHHITAQALDRNGQYSIAGTEISFYQTGCFTAIIPPADLSLVKRMRRTVTFSDI